MKISRATFVITLMAGITILLIGIYLQVTGSSSSGLTTDRFGNTYYGVFNGVSGISLGVVLLLLSVWIYRGYKKETENLRKMK